MKQQEFISADLYLSAAISVLLQIQPRYRVERGKTLFVFDVSTRLYEAMHDFNSGMPVNALEYATTLKRLKAEMLMRRNMSQTGVYHAG